MDNRRYGLGRRQWYQKSNSSGGKGRPKKIDGSRSRSRLAGDLEQPFYKHHEEWKHATQDDCGLAERS
jgi:hypothetical protein